MNGAIKSSTLLARADFASFNSSRRLSEIKNAAVIDKLRNATITSFRIDNDSHYKSSAVAEMGDHLATTASGQKVGDAVPLSVGELGLHLTQCSLGQGLPPCQVAF